MATKKKLDANAEYNKKTYEEVKIRVKKGEREKLIKMAESKGMSTNSYINGLIEKDMKIDPSTLDEPILKMIYNHPELIEIINIISSLPQNVQKEIAENLRNQAELIKDVSK